MTLALIALTYLIGSNLCYWMLLVDHKSEGNEVTRGDAALLILCSLLSWFCLLFILVSTWVAKVGKTGYWKQPINQKPKLDEPN